MIALTKAKAGNLFISITLFIIIFVSFLNLIKIYDFILQISTNTLAEQLLSLERLRDEVTDRHTFVMELSRNDGNLKEIETTRLMDKVLYLNLLLTDYKNASTDSFIESCIYICLEYNKKIETALSTALIPTHDNNYMTSQDLTALISDLDFLSLSALSEAKEYLESRMLKSLIELKANYGRTIINIMIVLLSSALLIIVALYYIYSRNKYRTIYKDADRIREVIFKNTTDVIWYCAADKSTLLFATPSFGKLFYSEKEPPSNFHPSSIKRYIIADDQESFAAAIDTFLKKDSLDAVIRIKQKDKSIKCIRLTIRPNKDALLSTIGYIAVARDMTIENRQNNKLRELLFSLKTQEQYLNSIIEHQTEMVCRFLPDTTITYANSAYCRHIGLPRHRIIGSKFTSFISNNRNFDYRSYLSSFSKEAATRTCIDSIKDVFGHVKWQEWTDSAIFNENEEIIEFQSSGRDITKLRESALKLKNQITLRDNLVREIKHRVFNNYQTLLALIRLKRQELTCRPPSHLVTTVERYIDIFNIAQEQIIKSKTFSTIELDGYIRDIANILAYRYADGESISLNIHAEQVTTMMDYANPLGVIISELFQYSLERASTRAEALGQPTISIACERDLSGMIRISYSDDICSDDFDTPEGQAGELELATILAEQQLSGSIEITRDARSFSFAISFPDNMYSERVSQNYDPIEYPSSENQIFLIETEDHRL